RRHTRFSRDWSSDVCSSDLGLAPADISGIQAKIGVCSKGTPNMVYSFGTRDALVEALGAGPLVEDAAIALDAGGPVICVPANTKIGRASGREREVNWVSK